MLLPPWVQLYPTHTQPHTALSHLFPPTPTQEVHHISMPLPLRVLYTIQGSSSFSDTAGDDDDALSAYPCCFEMDMPSSGLLKAHDVLAAFPPAAVAAEVRGEGREGGGVLSRNRSSIRQWFDLPLLPPSLSPSSRPWGSPWEDGSWWRSLPTVKHA